jgi:hypothetical protein
VVATILLVLVTFSFWSRPEKPPSASAELKAKSAGNEDSVKDFTYQGSHGSLGFATPHSITMCYRNKKFACYPRLPPHADGGIASCALIKCTI